MAPGILSDDLPVRETGSASRYPHPLRQSGALEEKFEYEDTTPVIGREFLNVNIVDDLINVRRFHGCKTFLGMIKNR